MNRVLVNLRRSLLLCAVLMFLSQAYAFEYTYEGNTLEYTILNTDGATLSVSVQKGSAILMGELVIPASVTLDGVNYEVTTVAAEGFSGCRQITKVELPNTITTIEDKGFYRCDKMTSISLNEGLRMIGDRAFCNDSALVETLVIPSTVDTIADFAFGRCFGLENIQFLSPVPAKVGGNNMFYESLPYVHILIPCGSYDAYADYTSYSYYIDSKGDTIYRHFYQNIVTDLCDESPIFSDNKLRYRVIDNSKKEVSVCGYLSNTIDGELAIPASAKIADRTYSVVEVDSSVFNTKSVRITSLVLPETMRKLNHAAFRRCHSLRSVTLNEGLEYIGNRAFCKDSLLTNITIPSTVTFMGGYCIGDCPKLEWVEMLPSAPPATDAEGPLAGMPKADKCDIIVPCGLGFTGGYTEIAPWNWHRIKDACLFTKGGFQFSRPSEKDTEVTLVQLMNPVNGTMTIPSNVQLGKYQLIVTEIADWACPKYRGGNGVTAIEIPGTVRSIGSNAFRDYPNLTSVRLSEGLKVIGNRAFCKDSALTKVVIPSTVDSIGGWAFGDCPKLSAIYAMGTTPPRREASGDTNPFVNASATGTVYVPCSYLIDYRTAWRNSGNILKSWTWGENCEMDIYHHNYPNAESLLTEAEADMNVDHILYHRIFKSGQWETLYLPFDVESVTLYDTDDNAEVEITPWVRGKGGHFWLLKQAGTFDEEGYPEFMTTDKVEGYTPYLIQFKQSWYDDKVVTFRSMDKPAIETKFSVKHGGTALMSGNNTMARQSVSCVYLLENNGNTFRHSSLSRALYPFECYVTDGVGVATQSRRFAIRYREAVSTDEGNVPQIDSSEMLCEVSGNTLTIHTHGEAVSVYSVNGTLLYAFPQGTATAAMDLESGYYIVATRYGSQKVVL